MLSAILMKIGFGVLQLLSRLPESWWYGIADIIAFLLQHIFKYRSSVISNNLQLSFPEKSKQETCINHQKVLFNTG
jgi:KDO2-lipid IV(A) lauroyltransferase